MLSDSHNVLCEQRKAFVATNLDVDIAAIEELMQLGPFRSKREAVDAAIREAITYRKQLKSCDYLGTIVFRPEAHPADNAP